MQFASQEYRRNHPLHLLPLPVSVVPWQKAQLLQCAQLHGRNLVQTRLELHTLQQGLHGCCDRAAHLMAPHHLHSADGWQLRQQQQQRPPQAQAQHAHHKKTMAVQHPSAREETAARRAKTAMTTQQLHQRRAHGRRPHLQAQCVAAPRRLLRLLPSWLSPIVNDEEQQHQRRCPQQPQALALD